MTLAPSMQYRFTRSSVVAEKPHDASYHYPANATQLACVLSDIESKVSVCAFFPGT